MLQRIAERLYLALQRALPARLLARGVYVIARSRRPLVKNLLVRGFVRLYRVDTSEAAEPVPDGYDCFNAFFTRALRPGARPLDPDPLAVVSPADGTIQRMGRVCADRIPQVKGVDYSATALLGGERAQPYRDGSFVTIYLAPRDYHRVHMPASGRVVRMTHVPGELWAVNATTTARVPGVFARNERLICHCEADWGPFAVILVGALNVGSISTAWAGEVLPRRTREITHWDYAAGEVTIVRGALLGQFNMGSTVVLLLPAGAVSWRDDLGAGEAVRTGAALGNLHGARAVA